MEWRVNTAEPLPCDFAGLLRFVDDFGVADAGAGTPPIVDIGACERYPRSRADFDRDGDVDRTDFSYFHACFNGPNQPYTESGCAAADLDGDADVDLRDFMLFQAAFNGPNAPPRK